MNIITDKYLPYLWKHSYTNIFIFIRDILRYERKTTIANNNTFQTEALELILKNYFITL